MVKAKRVLLSVVLVLSLVLSGFSGGGVTLAEETASVRMSINGGSETTEYASLMEAVHAIEAKVAENPDNEKDTYEIYLDSAQYSVDKDYVMPKAKKISFVGKNTSLDGTYYQISQIVLDGNVTFQSDLEMSNVSFAGLNDASLTAKDFFGSGLCWFGNDFNPVTSVNVENFYGFSYDTYTKLKAKNYNNLDELAEDFDVKNLGVKQLYFYGALNADNVTCATNAVFFRGQNVTSHIGSYTYISSEQNIWQQDGILFSTMPPMGDEDYIAVDIKDILIKYAKTSRLYWYMGTMKHEKTGISVENISVDAATTSADQINLEIVMGEYSSGDSFQPDCNLDITGQISGIDRITCVYSLMGFAPEDGKDWRELMKEQWGATSFKALTVSQPQKEEITFDAELSFPNGTGGTSELNIQKKGNEYRMDFTLPLYELMKLDDYVEKDGIYYAGGDGYVVPRFYVGDSDTLTIPSCVTIDDTECYVYYIYCPLSLKTNVKTIVLPEDTTHVPRLGRPVGSYYNLVNVMLAGGNDNSALECFELAGENINYSTDENGNLYNGNQSILYCCPPAKNSYTFPDTVTKIGDQAFMGCQMEELQVPEQIEIVGENAFRNMEQLKKVEFKGSNVIDFRGGSFYHVGSEDVVISSADNAIVKNEALLYDLKYREVSGAGLKGDLDEDGAVKLQDVQLALRAGLKIRPLSERQITAGDINRDGKVDLSDALFILKYVLLVIDDLDKVEVQEPDTEQGCEKNGHAYSTIKAATFDETGIKSCTECDKQIVIGKKNKNYLLTFIQKEATDYEDGYRIITDEDTGEYEEEVIMHLGAADAMN